MAHPRLLLHAGRQLRADSLLELCQWACPTFSNRFASNATGSFPRAPFGTLSCSNVDAIPAPISLSQNELPNAYSDGFSGSSRICDKRPSAAE